MILLNDHNITPTIFPDKTSQVWNIDPKIVKNHNVIHWEFESESELIHVAQLKDLVDQINPEGETSLFMPYLPYARQDKAVQNDQTFALRTFAKIINSLNFSLVETLDAHSEKCYLINNMCNLYGSGEVTDTLSVLDMENKEEVIIAYPDEGANVRYSRWYDYYPKVIGTKERDQQTGYIKKYIIQGNPDGKKVLMIDDICDGGMTFILMAKELYAQGAKEVNLFVTHGIFSKGIKPLKEAGIKRIFTRKGEIFESKDTNYIYKEF